MLSITKRPRGNRVSTTANTTYSISSDGYGNVIISGGSGLVNGDTILITNSFDSYNGFWYISGYGPNVFRLYDYSGGSLLDYTQSQANVTIYKYTNTVDYSCVHLPITYTITSDKFPTNTFDTTRSVSAFYNDGGYIKITVSGAITASKLDWLYFSNVGVDGLDGPIQILTVHSTTQFTINASYLLASGSVYTYSNATCVRYYHNYNVKVRIYGGLIGGHIWSSLKPIKLITEIVVSPDTLNNSKFNVADILKSYINVTRNRPNNDSMPYDIDRFEQFYISYAECYDSSNGVSVSTYTSIYTTDSFNGVAVDAKLEFKNRYSGYLADYVYYDASNLAKFLTMASNPVLFDNWYFDLSFINSAGSSDLVLVEDSYNEAGTLQSDNWTLYNNMSSIGVVRLPITNRGNFYQNCYVTNAITVIQGTLWTDRGGLFSNFTKASTTLSFASTTNESYIAEQPIVGINKDNYRDVTITIVLSGTWSAQLYIRLYVINSAGNGRFEQVLLTGNGTTVLTLTDSSDETSTSVYDKLILIGQVFNYVSGTVNCSVTITPGAFISKGATQYTETKRIDVNQKCSNEYIYLTWKNSLGGFDYWLFTAFKDESISILDTQTKYLNVYPNWENSYNEFAEGLSIETSRKSRRDIIVRSQTLTEAQINFVSGIKTSSLVQQMTSKYDRRTVIIDKSSFLVKKDNDKVYTLQFTISYTDLIPSQSL